MSDDVNLNLGELRRRRNEDENGEHQAENGRYAGSRSQPRTTTRISVGAPLIGAGSEPSPAPFSLWNMLELISRRWKWLAIGTLACGALAFLFGLRITSYTAKV